MGPDGTRIEVGSTRWRPSLEAVIAAEDRRFYSHGGLDPIGLSRASSEPAQRPHPGRLDHHPAAGEAALHHGERSFARKAQEAVLSVKLERTANKDQILERYLNIVYFGRGAYGIEAAARAYFGVPPPSSRPRRPPSWSGSSARPETAEPVEDIDEASPPAHGARRPWSTTARSAEPRPPPPAPPIEGPIPDPRRPPGAGPTSSRGSAGRRSPPSARTPSTATASGSSPPSTSDAQLAAEAAVAEILTDPPTRRRRWSPSTGRRHPGLRRRPRLRRPAARPGAGRRRRLRSPGRLDVQAVRAHGRPRRRGDAGRRVPGPRSIDLDVGGVPWSVENYGGSGYGELTVGRGHRPVGQHRLRPARPAGRSPGGRRRRPRRGHHAELDAIRRSPSAPRRCRRSRWPAAYLTLPTTATTSSPTPSPASRTVRRLVLWEPDRPGPRRAIDDDVSRAVTSALRGVIEAAPAGPPTSGDRPPARPAPPRTTSTPGSPATCPATPRWCGWATPRACRWRRARPAGHRRRAPRPDLAAVHGGGDGGPEVADFPEPVRRAGPRHHHHVVDVVDLLDDDHDHRARGQHHDGAGGDDDHLLDVTTTIPEDVGD